jgi:hypothetical protein
MPSRRPGIAFRGSRRRIGRIRFRENWSRDMWLLLVFVLVALFFLIRWLLYATP